MLGVFPAFDILLKYGPEVLSRLLGSLNKEEIGLCCSCGNKVYAKNTLPNLVLCTYGLLLSCDSQVCITFLDIRTLGDRL